MKKCFLMLAAFIIAASAFVSCTKDIKGDIDAINGKIDALNAQVTALDNQIKAGSVITNVENVAGVGVKVTLNNGKTFTLTNGKDADVWTVGQDGFWYKNGVKTANKAVGADGQKGADGKDGDVYVPNVDGYFYLNGVKTEYCWKAECVCAIFDENGRLFLANVDGTDEVIELGTSVLTEIHLDPFTVNEAGVAVYTLQALVDTLVYVSETATSSLGEVATNVIPVGIVLNPSNIDVEDYDWAVRATAAQTVKNIYSRTDLFDVLLVEESAPGEAIAYIALNSDFFEGEDVETTVYDFIKGVASKERQILIQLQATNNLGQTISSDQAQFNTMMTVKTVKATGLIVNCPITAYDFTVFDDEDITYPVARPANLSYVDSILSPDSHIVDSVYLSATFPLTPILLDGYNTVETNKKFEKLYYFSNELNGLYELEQPDAVNAKDAYLYNWSFPMYYKFEVADADKGYVVIDDEGCVSFKEGAKGKTVKIYMTPYLNGSALFNGNKVVKDSIQIKVGSNKPAIHSASVNLGNVNYSKIVSEEGFNTGHKIHDAFSALAKTTGLDGFASTPIREYDNYGHTGINQYYTESLNDTSFALLSSVPFGDGKAKYTFTNTNEDKIVINIAYKVVNDLEKCIELYDPSIYLSPVRSENPVLVDTYYDIKEFPLVKNVKKSVAFPACASLEYGLGKVDSLYYPSSAAAMAKINTVADGIISLVDTLYTEDEVYDTYAVKNAIVSVKVPSQHWENNAWQTSTLAYKVEFPVNFVNDLQVSAASNIKLTTKGNFATDTINIKDYLTVSTANDVVYKGAVINSGHEKINNLYAADNSFIKVELIEKSLPAIVATNGFVKQDPVTGAIYWDEAQAQACSYTQMSDVPVKAKVTVILGKNTHLGAVKEVTFILKNKLASN